MMELMKVMNQRKLMRTKKDRKGEEKVCQNQKRKKGVPKKSVSVLHLEGESASHVLWDLNLMV